MDTKPKKRQATRRNVVHKAVAMLGGQTETARLIGGITPQAVNKWCKQGYVPHNRCRTVEKLLGGRITRYALNPDTFGKAPGREGAA